LRKRVRVSRGWGDAAASQKMQPELFALFGEVKYSYLQGVKIVCMHD
jgi:hypothetical protein